MDIRHSAEACALQIIQLRFQAIPAPANIAGPWKYAIALTAGVARSVQVKQPLSRIVFAPAIIQHFAPHVAIHIVHMIGRHATANAKTAKVMHDARRMLFGLT